MITDWWQSLLKQQSSEENARVCILVITFKNDPNEKKTHHVTLAKRRSIAMTMTKLFLLTEKNSRNVETQIFAASELNASLSFEEVDHNLISHIKNYTSMTFGLNFG